MKDIKLLEAKLGYNFQNINLLRQAVTHSSYESSIHGNYERLEFLGDRVLGVAIASLLYKIFPNEPEGSLSQRHTGLVCKETVAEVARRLDLDKYIICVGNEIHENENVLCDVCEAVIGAIFIDSHCERAVEFVNEHWRDLIDKNMAPPKDSKTLLQEVAHVKGYGFPIYQTEDRTGTEHEPTFVMSVTIEGFGKALGSGKNKKIAEQDAAKKMLIQLENKQDE